MLGVKAKCPSCNRAVSTKTTRCPHCKKTIPKKFTDTYHKGENLFWIIFLAGFCLCLIIPVIFYDFLGAKWGMIVATAGIILSFAAAYIVMRSTIRAVHNK